MAKAGSSKHQTHATRKLPKKVAARQPSPEDEFLHSDSEEDEFAQGYQPGLAEEVSDEDDDDEEDDDDDDEEGEANAQWAPDDWNEDEEPASGSEDDSDDSEGQSEDDKESVELKRLQKNLKALPLSTLAKAQKSISRKSLEFSSSGQSKEERLLAAKQKLAQLQRNKGKHVDVPAAEIVRKRKDESDSDSDSGPETESSGKRSNKHAPVAMSTKKQVSRRRQVIDVPKPERRDPRFSSVSAGQVNPEAAAHSYAFIPDLLKGELKSLKQQVGIARRAERTCPLVEKPLRTAELEMLELEMGKVRTKLARSQKEELEREALSKAKKEEKEKQAQGKGAWYMKKSEKKDLLLKARFQQLEKQGGKTAVKKLVEKKRKKIAGKEKKSRPFARGQESMGRDNKRRRVA